ncbi:protein of unknown function [Paenibacillus alvei]|uniref:Uncharacterized protein n=1 Tax=Paenibacillus alvei TaxID=44250 RepID=A0A383R8Z2_PAEAL|nr:protein of unknown function [Paenibacillus alvei]
MIELFYSFYYIDYLVIIVGGIKLRLNKIKKPDIRLVIDNTAIKLLAQLRALQTLIYVYIIIKFHKKNVSTNVLDLMNNNKEQI